jgi:transketolase
VIGKGSPNKQGKEPTCTARRWAPTKSPRPAKLGWNHPPFEIPADIYRRAWDARERAPRWKPPGSALPPTPPAHPNWLPSSSAAWPANCRPTGTRKPHAYILAKIVAAKAETIATRKASRTRSKVSPRLLPELLGGSADLAGSNLTNWSGSKASARDGRQLPLLRRARIRHGRDHATALPCTAVSFPYGATFLMFSEYARNALRMAALMKQRVICVFTHDSIGLGEDGPTHQPVEHAATLRLMPNMDVWRPCDTVETAVAWAAAIERSDGPTSLLLSRQNLPHQSAMRRRSQANAARGGYVLAEARWCAARVIIATGSEVAWRWQAQQALAEQKALPCAWCRCPAPACSTARMRRTVNQYCRGHPARRRRSRCQRLLAQVRRTRRRRHRHRPLRRIGPGRPAVQVRHSPATPSPQHRAQRAVTHSSTDSSGVLS